MLKETTDAKIIGTFGYKSSKDTDKFDGIDFKEISEIPVLENTCGYIHEADEFPDDFKCPICGVGKESFELVEY
ncbi:MAG: rubredoxin-like domain-containing protein [Candidatus Coprovivens sp.]